MHNEDYILLQKNKCGVWRLFMAAVKSFNKNLYLRRNFWSGFFPPCTLNDVIVSQDFAQWQRVGWSKNFDKKSSKVELKKLDGWIKKELRISL